MVQCACDAPSLIVHFTQVLGDMIVQSFHIILHKVNSNHVVMQTKQWGANANNVRFLEVYITRLEAFQTCCRRKYFLRFQQPIGCTLALILASK